MSDAQGPGESGPQTQLPRAAPVLTPAPLPPTAAERGGIRALFMSIIGLLLLFLPVPGRADRRRPARRRRIVTGVARRRRARRILTRAPGAVGGIVIGAIGLCLALVGLVIVARWSRRSSATTWTAVLGADHHDKQTCQDRYFPQIEHKLHLPKGTLAEQADRAGLVSTAGARPASMTLERAVARGAPPERARPSPGSVSARGSRHARRLLPLPDRRDAVRQASAARPPWRARGSGSSNSTWSRRSGAAPRPERRRRRACGAGSRQFAAQAAMAAETPTSSAAIRPVCQADGPMTAIRRAADRAAGQRGQEGHHAAGQHAAHEAPQRRRLGDRARQGPDRQDAADDTGGERHGQRQQRDQRRRAPGEGSAANGGNAGIMPTNTPDGATLVPAPTAKPGPTAYDDRPDRRVGQVGERRPADSRMPPTTPGPSTP